MAQIMFGFTFAHLKGIPNKNSLISVYSYDREDIIKFIRQHGFDLNNAHIDVYQNPEPFFADKIEMVKPYHFHSNKTNKDYTIMTTEFIVTETITKVGGDLVETLTFNNGLITRDDIPLIRNIVSLIGTLDFCIVVDYTNGDVLTDDYMDRFNVLNHKKFKEKIENSEIIPENVYAYSDGLDDSFIYDTLYNESEYSTIQPITVEAYVSAFVEYITDEYC